VHEPERALDLGPRPVGVRPIAARSLVDLVLDEIRRSLLDGSLVPGASFSIADLSERLGVSHIPVREALRRLEAEGLVELRHGRSARVAPMSRADLGEIFRLRALIESDAVARSVRLYSEADLAAIEEAWAGLLVRPDESPEEVFVRHRELHELLVAPAAGAWDRRVREVLWRAAERYMALLILERDLSEAPTALRESHRALVDAVATRSAPTARRAVREHVEAAVDLIAALLG
jgi:DNA-binding GntR family transcriptional regulator